MKYPLPGQIVMFRTESGFQTPAVITSVEDVPHGTEPGIRLCLFRSESVTFTDGYVFQGNEIGQWQWSDIPIE